MNVIITGASQGFGKIIATKFLEHKNNIAICSRNIQELEKTHNELISTAKSIVYSKSCDVSKETDVNSFVDESIQVFGNIDTIVLNAGIYGPMGSTESVDINEWIKTIEVNLYGVLYPCRRIISHFKQNKRGKIIIVSGGGATNPMPNITAYASSKAAVIRLMESLAHELKPYNIDVNAVAPGALATRLVDQVLNAGPDVVGSEFYDKNLAWKTKGATSPELGAELIYYLAGAESNGITGRLLSAQWDNWKDLSSHLNELNPSDIYCLRRIVPEDRKKDWN
jgi:NAD(P)-dependent dehydrogenase (short-subunit alcohol dehydrogenase family)